MRLALAVLLIVAACGRSSEPAPTTITAASVAPSVSIFPVAPPPPASDVPPRTPPTATAPVAAPDPLGDPPCSIYTSGLFADATSSYFDAKVSYAPGDQATCAQACPRAHCAIPLRSAGEPLACQCACVNNFAVSAAASVLLQGGVGLWPPLPASLCTLAP